MAAPSPYMRIDPAVLLGLGLATLFPPHLNGQEGIPAASVAAPSQVQSNSVSDRLLPDHVRPQMYYPQRRRSIIHHYPYPYPGYYQNDDTAGFRNPGNVGRHAEYYLPGDRFQVEGDPVRPAQFGVGGYPSRAEQMEAQRIGISRDNSIQGHIDRYAAPHWGYGFGVGGFGGFW
ncbi:MAG: hypothetical protein ACLP7Q_15035 [Isosphaeraceae bacterium]